MAEKKLHKSKGVTTFLLISLNNFDHDLTGPVSEIFDHLFTLRLRVLQHDRLAGAVPNLISGEDLESRKV